MSKIPGPNDWRVMAKDFPNCIHPFADRDTRTVEENGEHYCHLFCTRCDKVLHVSKWDITTPDVGYDPRNHQGVYA